VTGRRAAFLVGRAIFGGYFVYNGINHFKQQRMMAGYAGSKGVPAPDVAIPATGTMLLAGGASVITGVAPTWGLGALLLFLAGVTPSIHRFWDEQDPQKRMNEMVNFTKNVALAGACLMLLEMPEPWNEELEEYDLEVEVDDSDPLLAA
jgi:uncharacterized membrane protein YphA (DoxX/SURF4 family)